MFYNLLFIRISSPFGCLYVFFFSFVYTSNFPVYIMGIIGSLKQDTFQAKILTSDLTEISFNSNAETYNGTATRNAPSEIKMIVLENSTNLGLQGWWIPGFGYNFASYYPYMGDGKTGMPVLSTYTANNKKGEEIYVYRGLCLTISTDLKTVTVRMSALENSDVSNRNGTFSLALLY